MSASIDPTLIQTTGSSGSPNDNPLPPSTSTSDAPQEQSTSTSISPPSTSASASPQESSTAAGGPIASAFPNMSTDLYEELQESLKSLTDHETRRGQFYYNDESLVICEDDFIFNNRWFHTTAEPGTSDLVKVHREVMMKTPVLFIMLVPRLSKFTNLKRMKISKITFEDLLALEKVPLLEHLEIDALTVTNDCAAKLNNPVQLPRLNRLKIREINNGFSSITFLTPELNAVYFGQQVDLLKLLFTEQLVVHCEVELLRQVADVSQFDQTRTLVCNNLLAGSSIRWIVELIKLMANLTEVYLNFEEFTSLTEDYSHLSKQLESMPGIFEKLIACEKSRGLQVYIQGVPLLEFQKYQSTPGLLNASLLSLQYEMTKGRFAGTHSLLSSMVHRSIAHVDFGKLQCKIPDLLKDSKFLQLMQRKFPGLQNVEIDQESINRPIDISLLLPFLQSLRAVQKLFFNRCDVDPDFYSIVLPAMPSLVDSLIVLKIFDCQLPDKFSRLSLYFLRHLKCLRHFGTNLICRDAITYALGMVTRFPFTFTFAFKMTEIDDHAVVIRKQGEDGYHAVLQERSRRHTLDTERCHDLNQPSKLLNMTRLVRLLKDDARCNLLLRHKYDDTQGALDERITGDFIKHVSKVKQFDHKEATEYINQLIDSSPKRPTRPTKRVQFSEHTQVRTFKSDLEGTEEITEQESTATTQSEGQPVQQEITESQRVLQSVAGDLLAQAATEPDQTLQPGDQSQEDQSQGASESPPPAPSIQQMFDQALSGSDTGLSALESMKLLLSGQFSSSLPGSSQTDPNSSIANLSKVLAQGGPSTIQRPAVRTPAQAPSAQIVGTKRSYSQTTPTKTVATKTAPSKKAKRELQASPSVQSSSALPPSVLPPSALPSLPQPTPANPPAQPTTSTPFEKQLFASFLDFEAAQREYVTLRNIILNGQLPADRKLFGEAVECANQICLDQEEASMSEGTPNHAQLVAYFETTNKNLANLRRFLVYFRQWAREQSLQTLQATLPTPSSTQPLAQSLAQPPTQSLVQSLAQPPTQPSTQSLAQSLAQPPAQSLAQVLAQSPAQSLGQPLNLQNQFAQSLQALQGATLPASPLVQPPTFQLPVPPTSIAQFGQGLQGYPFGQTLLLPPGQPGPLSTWPGPPVTQILTPVTHMGPAVTQMSLPVPHVGPPVTQMITPVTPVTQFIQTPASSSLVPSLPGSSIAQTTPTYTMAVPSVSSLAAPPPPSQPALSSQAAPVSESSSVPPNQSSADSNDQILAAVREGTFFLTLEMLQNYRTEFEQSRQTFRDLVVSRGSPNLQIIPAIEKQFADFELKLKDCNASIEFEFGLAAVQTSQREMVDSLLKLRKIMEAGQSMLRTMNTQGR